jgi:uncharacterized protein
MHRLLSTERSGRDAPGHHGAKAPGYGCGAQSHQASDEGDFPASPSGATAWMGLCAEPSPWGRHSRVSGTGTGTITPFSRQATGRIFRGGAYALRLLLLGLIRFYQICLSPVIPSSCRYFPSCSAYAYEALEKWGAWEGTRLAVRRLLRCRPWGGHGYDPVP